jgi:TonB family protein
MSASTLLANLVAYSFQITFLVTAGTLVLLLLRLRHPGALLLYWQLLLGACLLLPAIEPWQKPVSRDFLTLAGRTTRVESRLGPLSAGPKRFLTSKFLADAVAIGAGLRLLWLTLGLLRLGQYRRQARSLNPLPLAVEEMQEKIDVHAQVCLSAELHSPVTFGLRRPVLLLPRNFLNMDLSQQRAVACHELWHIRRKDWIFALLEGLVTTPFWFHPAIWWLLDRIRLCREQVIDQLVLKTTQQRKAYLDALLETALARQHPRFTPAPLFLRQRHLTQRIASILKEVSMSKTRVVVSLAVASFAVFLTGVAGVKVFPLESGAAPEAQSAEPKPPDNASQNRLIVAPDVLAKNLVHQVKPIYPPEAKQLGIQGEVLLEVSINQEGGMENIRVTKGHPILVLPALVAVKQWKYRPYLVNGAPEPVMSTVSVNFTLEDAATGTGEQSQTPLIRLNSDKMAANVIYRVEPVYPPEAKQKGVEGEVVFEVTINEQGEVSDVQVLSGNAMLVSAAYEAVRQWRYTPVLLNGDPIRAKSTVTIRFTLEKNRTSASEVPRNANPNLRDFQIVPSDLTPEQHARRLVYADERFTTSDRPGSQTDRGRVYLAWGPPDQIESHPDSTPPFEDWRYWNRAGKPDQGHFDLRFVGADYKLVHRTGAAQ